jgi:hypothetical protein
VGSGRLLELIRARMPDLSRPIQKNLALVSAALLALCSGPRSANGKVSLSALARVLPSKGSEKTRAKRFWRFLANPRLCPEAMIPQLVRLVLGCLPAARIPLLLDQTDICGVQTILVGVIFKGRVLPVAFTCFLYCQIRRSQNLLETNLLKLVADAFPKGREPVFIADRQYGRSQSLRKNPRPRLRTGVQPPGDCFRRP